MCGTARLQNLVVTRQLSLAQQIFPMDSECITAMASSMQPDTMAHVADICYHQAQPRHVFAQLITGYSLSSLRHPIISFVDHSKETHQHITHPLQAIECVWGDYFVAFYALSMVQKRCGMFNSITRAAYLAESQRFRWTKQQPRGLYQ